MKDQDNAETIVIEAMIDAEAKRIKGERFRHARLRAVPRLRVQYGVVVANRIVISILNRLGYTEED